MKNRLIALILIVCLMPINYLQVNATIVATDQDTFFKYLGAKGIETKTQRMVYNAYTGRDEKLIANYDIYREYNEIVYGYEKVIAGNDTKFSEETGKIEYRYLGYMVDGRTKVRNNKFPPDVMPSTSPLNWHYLEVGKRGLWESAIDKDISDYLYTAPLFNPTYNIPENKAEIYGLTAKYIDDHGRSKDSSPNGKRGAYARLQTLPTWFSEGTVYINKYSSGRKWYATFRVPGFGIAKHSGLETKIEYTIDAPKTIIMEAGEDKASFTVDVSSDIILQGMAKAEHIKNYTIDIQGNENTVNATTKNNHTRAYTVKRSELKIGSNPIDVPITISYETIFHDKRAVNETKEIEIIVKDKDDTPNPVPIAPTPEEKPQIKLIGKIDPVSTKYKGTNVKVAITPTAYLYNVDNAEVTKFELKVEGQAYSQSNITTLTNIFNSTIDKKDIEKSIDTTDEEDSTYTKKYAITAVAFLTDGTILSATLDKEAKVIENNALPTVQILSDDEVRVGDYIHYRADASSPIGLDIVDYIWRVENAVGEILPGNESGSVYYTTEGKKDVRVSVKDEMDNRAKDEKEVTVIPAYHYANIKYDGVLKENRIIDI